MSDTSRANFDPNDLKGLILIRSTDKITGEYYFAIASYELDRIRSALRKVPKGLEEHVVDMAAQMQKWKEAREMQGDFSPRTLTFAFIAKDSIDSYILADDIDEYNAESMTNLENFMNFAHDFAESYLSKYRGQQTVKNREKGTEKATIYEIPEKYRLQSLVNLFRQLVAATKANDPIAQLDAEDNLHNFVANPSLSYHVNEIIRLTASKIPDKNKLILMQSAIIDSLVKEDYSTAASLHKSYTGLTDMKLS